MNYGSNISSSGDLSESQGLANFLNAKSAKEEKKIMKEQMPSTHKLQTDYKKEQEEYKQYLRSASKQQHQQQYNQYDDHMDMADIGMYDGSHMMDGEEEDSEKDPYAFELGESESLEDSEEQAKQKYEQRKKQLQQKRDEKNKKEKEAQEKQNREKEQQAKQLQQQAQALALAQQLQNKRKKSVPEADQNQNQNQSRGHSIDDSFNNLVHSGNNQNLQEGHEGQDSDLEADFDFKEEKPQIYDAMQTSSKYAAMQGSSSQNLDNNNKIEQANGRKQLNQPIANSTQIQQPQMQQLQYEEEKLKLQKEIQDMKERLEKSAQAQTQIQQSQASQQQPQTQSQNGNNQNQNEKLMELLRQQMQAQQSLYSQVQSSMQNTQQNTNAYNAYSQQQSSDGALLTQNLKQQLQEEIALHLKSHNLSQQQPMLYYRHQNSNNNNANHLHSDMMGLDGMSTEEMKSQLRLYQKEMDEVVSQLETVEGRLRQQMSETAKAKALSDELTHQLQQRQDYFQQVHADRRVQELERQMQSMKGEFIFELDKQRDELAYKDSLLSQYASANKSLQGNVTGLQTHQKEVAALKNRIVEQDALLKERADLIRNTCKNANLNNDDNDLENDQNNQNQNQILEQEISLQEMLIRGFQKENEKLCVEKSQIQAKLDAANKMVYDSQVSTAQLKLQMAQSSNGFLLSQNDPSVQQLMRNVLQQDSIIPYHVLEEAQAKVVPLQQSLKNAQSEKSGLEEALKKERYELVQLQQKLQNQEAEQKNQLQKMEELFRQKDVEAQSFQKQLLQQQAQLIEYQQQVQQIKSSDSVLTKQNLLQENNNAHTSIQQLQTSQQALVQLQPQLQQQPAQQSSTIQMKKIQGVVSRAGVLGKGNKVNNSTAKASNQKAMLETRILDDSKKVSTTATAITRRPVSGAVQGSNKTTTTVNGNNKLNISVAQQTQAQAQSKDILTDTTLLIKKEQKFQYNSQFKNVIEIFLEMLQKQESTISVPQQAFHKLMRSISVFLTSFISALNAPAEITEMQQQGESFLNLLQEHKHNFALSSISEKAVLDSLVKATEGYNECLRSESVVDVYIQNQQADQAKVQIEGSPIFTACQTIGDKIKAIEEAFVTLLKTHIQNILLYQQSKQSILPAESQQQLSVQKDEIAQLKEDQKTLLESVDLNKKDQTVLQENLATQQVNTKSQKQKIMVNNYFMDADEFVQKQQTQQNLILNSPTSMKENFDVNIKNDNKRMEVYQKQVETLVKENNQLRFLLENGGTTSNPQTQTIQESDNHVAIAVLEKKLELLERSAKQREFDLQLTLQELASSKGFSSAHKGGVVSAVQFQNMVIQYENQKAQLFQVIKDKETTCAMFKTDLDAFMAQIDQLRRQQNKNKKQI